MPKQEVIEEIRSKQGNPEDDFTPVPTQTEARKWAAKKIAREYWDWDAIAENADPDGGLLSQEGCDVVAEALYSCSVTMTWPDGQYIRYEADER